MAAQVVRASAWARPMPNAATIIPSTASPAAISDKDPLASVRLSAPPQLKSAGGS